MIRINQLKLPLEYEKEKLLQKAARILGISPADILKIDIIKESIDARKKPEIFYSYIVDVTLKSGGSKREESIVRKKRTVIYQSAMRSHTACRSVELPLWHTLRLLSGLVRPDCSAV